MALRYDVIYMDEDGTPVYGVVDDGVPDDEPPTSTRDDDEDIYIPGDDEPPTSTRDDEEGVYIPGNPTIKTVPEAESWLSTILKSFGKSAYDTAKKAVFNGGDPANGLNFAGIATAIGLVPNNFSAE